VEYLRKANRTCFFDLKNVPSHVTNFKINNCSNDSAKLRFKPIQNDNYLSFILTKNNSHQYLPLMSPDTNKSLIIFSFFIIYVVWGSTYLASDYVLEQVPAFRLCGIRYICAALLALGLNLVLFSPKLPEWSKIKNALIAGFVFMGLGTGGAIWSLNYLDTGLTALIISAEPLVIVLMMWVINSKRPSLQAFMGIAIGMGGMAILVSQKEIISTPNQWVGVLVIFLSMIAWGGGSIFVSKAELPDSHWTNSTIQMFSGGVTTLVISFILGEQNESVSLWTTKTWASLSYLIVFGSVVAFTAFNFLLRNVSTEKVATNTYVNPIIAMYLGYQFNGELVPFLSIVAAAIMLIGVFVINTNK